MLVGNSYLKILLFYCIPSLQWNDGNLVSCGVGTEGFNAIYRKLLQIHTLPFEDCGSRYNILYVSISSCTSIPCQMHRGSTVMVNMIFDDHGENTTFLKQKVRWIFNAVKTNASITPDPCDSHNKCLKNETDGKSFWASLLVNNQLPVIRGSIMWEAVNAKNQEVICLNVPVIIST